LTLDRKCPGAEWRIGNLENVFPVFVAEIRPAGKKIQFSVTARSAKPPHLHLRIRRDGDVDDDVNFVRLETAVDENSVEKFENKFEQFVFLFEDLDEDKGPTE
jgi:hypothetical protein